MPTKIRNVYKFKLKETGVTAIYKNSEGYVEFVGRPSVRDFINWTAGLKRPCSRVELDGAEIPVDDIMEGRLECNADVRQIRWKQDYRGDNQFNIISLK